MPTVHRIRQVLERPPFTADLTGIRPAAVAAIIDERGHLLFIRRATSTRDPWSGHLSFPGGRHDPGDPDLLATAIRETHEEIGLDLSGAELLGRLDDLPTMRPIPRLVVRPFVFHVPSFGALSLDASEVAGTHTLSLEHLLDGTGRGSFSREWEGRRFDLPKVDFDGVMLWGLTLQLVDDLLHRLDGRGQGTRRPEGR